MVSNKMVEQKGNILMKRYEIGKLLGQGSFAKVYHGRNVKNSQSVAIKVIDKEKILKSELMDQIRREISVMNLVRHPCIVQLYEVMATKSKIYFVLEYVKGGELFNKIRRGRLKEEVARKYFQQLISAIDFCHSRGVYHRDLKPENLLLDENRNLKISDFGLSAFAECKRQDGLLHTTCGTPAYVAPEVINRKGYDGAKADVWACGVILYVLLAGYLPFQDKNVMNMYKKICRAELKWPSWFPSDVRKLLRRILDPNPTTRISVSEIMENPWFRVGLDSDLLNKTIPTEDVIPVHMDSTSDHFTKNTNEEKQAAENLTSLNAFDIISLSSGFDLSGMFEDDNSKEEPKFTSTNTVVTITKKLEDVAKSLQLKFLKKSGGLLKMEGSKPGRKGVMSINAEIFQITPNFHLVEFTKTNGDTLEYQKVKQEMRPALKDIVWAWQGELPQPLNEQL
ncbi:CBL-interacting protein kinase 10 [Oryza brachyantha]|uniref:non-specific serine/threonine protein kinase n=1 Tax=Oryza brachyantha TaxID=4533 RepID=J3LNK6_ORYBR|nr:CBL-interacting protein kinase 10 [Oryza brachyantha]